MNIDIKLLNDLFDKYGLSDKYYNISYETPKGTITSDIFGYASKYNSFTSVSIYKKSSHENICKVLLDANIPFIVDIYMEDDDYENRHPVYTGYLSILVMRDKNNSYFFKNVSNQFDPKTNDRLWDLDEYNIHIINEYKVLNNI